jgi:hypothetical protein
MTQRTTRPQRLWYATALLVLALMGSAPAQAQEHSARPQLQDEYDTVQPTHALPALEWVESWRTSCSITCFNVGRNPVISGHYVNGNPFYVCAANVNGEGYRVGFNLQPSWSSACWVAWNGQEPAIPNFRCLCQ